MLQLIVLLVVFFVLLLLVLHFLFGKELKIALGRLEILHQESLEKEDVLNKELERARALSQSEIERSKEEARVIVETARHNADKISVESIERTEAEVKKILTEAAVRVKKLEEEAIAGAQDKAVGFAMELLQSVFSEKNMDLFHRQMIDGFIDELKGVDKNRITARADRVEVITAVVLTPAQKQKLTDVLALLLGQGWVFEEKVDESIVAGIVVRFGGLVIDASLKNKLMKALQILRQKQT